MVGPAGNAPASSSYQPDALLLCYGPMVGAVGLEPTSSWLRVKCNKPLYETPIFSGHRGQNRTVTSRFRALYATTTLRGELEINSFNVDISPLLVESDPRVELGSMGLQSTARPIYQTDILNARKEPTRGCFELKVRSNSSLVQRVWCFVRESNPRICRVKAVFYH